MAIDNLNNIELNEDFVEAFNLMENTNKNIFLTGKAGTGKSTLLSYFRYKTKKNVVVLAPTGVAALNIKGQTIHSFFEFKPNVSEAKIRKRKTEFYKKIDCIVIDEISMVRADLIDCVDKFLRLNGKDKKKSFGGIQMIFIGDLYQLPPVVTNLEREAFKECYETPYFFSSKVFKNLDFEFIELNKIYRQKDNLFINLLNIIRSNSIKPKQLEVLNKRYNKFDEINDDDFYINLTTTNKKADEINLEKLKELKTKEYKYKGIIKGDFESNYLPTESELKIKIGAQVMMLNNDSDKRWVNGSVGKVVDIIKDSDTIYENENEIKVDIIVVELDNGEVVEVEPYKWDVFNYVYDNIEEVIESKVIGSFIQYPIKLAWAITIHKSQGKTFDKVIIDFDRGTFAHGQAYVALSRCTSLEGIILKNKVKKEHILLDNKVVEFIKNINTKISEIKLPRNKKYELLEYYVLQGTKIKIIYLKDNGEKIRKEIIPLEIIKNYKNKNKIFDALKGIKTDKKEIIIFNLDSILSIEVI